MVFSKKGLRQYVILAKGPGVVRGKNKFENKQNKFENQKNWPMSVKKNFSPFGPAVWPTIGNIYIYTNVLFYYIAKLTLFI